MHRFQASLVDEEPDRAIWERLGESFVRSEDFTLG
jgi:hypothetical protein